MKVVLDTNVFISAVFFGGTPGKILEAWHYDRLELVISSEIIEEYVRVGEQLAEKFPGVDLDPALDLVASAATLVLAAALPERVSRDQDDDKFLACAHAAGVEFVVSGDKDLLDVGRFEEVIILSPRVFVDTILA